MCAVKRRAPHLLNCLTPPPPRHFWFKGSIFISRGSTPSVGNKRISDLYLLYCFLFLCPRGRRRRCVQSVTYTPAWFSIGGLPSNPSLSLSLSLEPFFSTNTLLLGLSPCQPRVSDVEDLLSSSSNHIYF